MRKAKKLETNLKINYANTMRLIELKDNKLWNSRKKLRVSNCFDKSICWGKN